MPLTLELSEMIKSLWTSSVPEVMQYTSVPTITFISSASPSLDPFINNKGKNTVAESLLMIRLRSYYNHRIPHPRLNKPLNSIQFIFVLLQQSVFLRERCHLLLQGTVLRQKCVRICTSSSERFDSHSPALAMPCSKGTITYPTTRLNGRLNTLVPKVTNIITVQDS